VAAGSDHPTILIVHEDAECRAILSRILHESGYLVLETHNTLKALVIAIRHSRSIHLLLTDDSDDSRDLAATLKPYRPDMKVIHTGPNLEPDLILMEVSTVLDLPIQGFEKNESSGTHMRTTLEAEVETARHNFLEASRNFLELTNDVLSGLPHPNRVGRVQRSAKAVQRAFDNYLKARKTVEGRCAAADNHIEPRQKKKREK